MAELSELLLEKPLLGKTGISKPQILFNRYYIGGAN